jgi:hypothetical protein
MFRIALLLFSMIATTLAGSAVVVALTIGQDTLGPILTAAGLGLPARRAGDVDRRPPAGERG